MGMQAAYSAEAGYKLKYLSLLYSVLHIKFIGKFVWSFIAVKKF